MSRVFSQEDGNLDNAAIVTSRKKVYKDIDLTFAVRTMGDVFKKTDAASVKQAVKNILLTNHFEKPFTPFFGGNLHSFLFENIEDLDEMEIMDHVSAAINNYEPRAIIRSLKANARPDNNSIELIIRFQIINTFENVELNVELTRLR